MTTNRKMSSQLFSTNSESDEFFYLLDVLERLLAESQLIACAKL